MKHAITHDERCLKFSAGLAWIATAIAFTFAFLIFSPNYQYRYYQFESDHRLTPLGADFLQEWIGGRMIVEGRASELFDQESFKNWQHDKSKIGFDWSAQEFFPPVYPPPHYLLATPLSVLPYRFAVLTWLFILVLASLVSIAIISRLSQLPLVLVGLAVLIFPPLISSIAMGQKSALWLAILCGTVYLWQNNKPLIAGMLFGLISIKPTLFFLLPIAMLLKREWKFLIGTTWSVALIWGTAFLSMSSNVWPAYLTTIGQIASYTSNSGYRLEWSCNLMSLAHLLPSTFAFYFKRIVVPALGLLLLYCIHRDKKKTPSQPRFLFFVIAITFLLSPHAYSYDLVVFLLPVIWMAACDRRHAILTYATLTFSAVMANDFYKATGTPLTPLILCAVSLVVYFEWNLPIFNSISQFDSEKSNESASSLNISRS